MIKGLVRTQANTGRGQVFMTGVLPEPVLPKTNCFYNHRDLQIFLACFKSDACICITIYQIILQMLIFNVDI